MKNDNKILIKKIAKIGLKIFIFVAIVLWFFMAIGKISTEILGYDNEDTTFLFLFAFVFGAIFGIIMTLIIKHYSVDKDERLYINEKLDQFREQKEIRKNAEIQIKIEEFENKDK